MMKSSLVVSLEGVSGLSGLSSVNWRMLLFQYSGSTFYLLERRSPFAPELLTNNAEPLMRLRLVSQQHKRHKGDRHTLRANSYKTYGDVYDKDYVLRN
jgi:hypothetical protein